MIRRLFGRSLRQRDNRDEHAAFGFGLELDATVTQCEQRMILAKPDIAAGVPLGAALARDDVAGDHGLTAENLHAQPLTVRVAAVTRGSACFLVSHNASPKLAYF